MYDLFLATQYIGIIFLILELIYIIIQRPTSLHGLLILSTVSTLVNFVGYLFELTATTKEEALLAVKFIYLGKPFIALSVFLFVAKFCKVKISSWIKGAMVLLHLSVFFLVLTCEHHTIFYSSIDFTTEGLFPHLVLGHGAIYLFYYALLAFYLIVLACFCIHCYLKTTSSMHKKQLNCLILMIFTTAAGFIIYLSGITKGYDCTVPAYLIATVFLTLSITKYRLFDTISLAKENAMDTFSEGLLVFDNDSELLYSNSTAQQIFPSLLSKDYKNDTMQLKKLSDCNLNLHKGDRIYEITQRQIIRNNVPYGTMYILHDMTDTYNYTDRLKKDVAEQTKKVISIQHSVIASFAKKIEARDGVTGLHIKHTCEYVKIVAKALKEEGKYKDILTDEYLDYVIQAAPLHDIGKIAIPDYVLKKADRLTNEEFEIIKTHPAVGAKIIDETLAGLEDDAYVKITRDVALYHHEKWDGNGYPKGLKGEDIPLCARIMAIADVYDALRSKRSYKEGFSKEKSKDIIWESSGTHFDPEIVETFMNHIEEIEQVTN